MIVLIERPAKLSRYTRAAWHPARKRTFTAPPLRRRGWLGADTNEGGGKEEGVHEVRASYVDWGRRQGRK